MSTSVLSRGIMDAVRRIWETKEQEFLNESVGTLLPGYPLLLHQGKTSVVIRYYAVKGGAAGPHGSGPYLTRPTAPDPLPAQGRVRRRHVSLRKGSSELTAEAPDPP